MSSTVPFNFGGLEDEFSAYEKAKTVILPVPFEQSSSWIKGSARGPESIINASRHMELYDIETDSEVYRKGMHTASAVEQDSAVSMVDEVYRRNLEFLKDLKFPVTVGGEHTVSIGALKAASEYHGGLSVLHLDAHSDFRQSYEGDPYSHACVMARVREFGADIFSVGIRSMDFSEKESLENSKTVFAHEVFNDKNWEKKVLKGLKDKVFIDIDLDVFDPSVIPATGTPEPGGMLWQQVTGLIKKIAEKKHVAGLGVVELCPVENSSISEFAASVLIYKTLSYINTG